MRLLLLAAIGCHAAPPPTIAQATQPAAPSAAPSVAPPAAPAARRITQDLIDALDANTPFDEDAMHLTFGAHRARPRSRSTIVAALALAVVVAVGAYAWRMQQASEAPAPLGPAAETVAPQAAPGAQGAPIASPPDHEPPRATSGSANEAPAPATDVDAKRGNAPALEADATADNPGADPSQRAGDTEAQPAASPPSAGMGTNAPSGGARTGTSAAAPKTRGASQDALATERVIRRALGGFTTPPKPPPPPR